MTLSIAGRAGRRASIVWLGALALTGYSAVPARAEVVTGDPPSSAAAEPVQEGKSGLPANTEAPPPSQAPDPASPPSNLEAPATTSEPEKKPAKPKDYREGLGFAGLPLANYNSDDGFGYGVKVALYDYGKNQKPYKWQAAIQLFFTTRKIMYHRIFFDAPRFMGTPWRVEARLNYDRVLLDNYFGIGNAVPICSWTGGSVTDATSELCPTGADLEGNTDGLDSDFINTNGDRIQNYYTSFQRKEPKVILNLRRDLSGPFKLFSGLQLKRTFIQPHDDATILKYTDLQVPETWTSFLETEQEQPYGFSGGMLGYLQLGIILDSRNREPSPDKGTFSEVSARFAYNRPVDVDERTANSPVFGGINVTTRNYLTVVPTLVFASRVVVDLMLGDVPFYELSTFGGSQDYSGLGGSVSVRGLTSNRYRGEVKVIATPELRWTPIEFYAGTQKFNIAFVGFTDAGRTWSKTGFDGDSSTIHLGVGGGLRIAWNDNFLIRLDVGKSLETNPDLTLPNAGAITGFYLVFDHAF